MSGPDDAPLLEVDRVCRSFGGLCALRGVSLRVEPGEIVAIIGPNGSGKTTLFNIITGIYAPDTGRVVFRGQDIVGRRRHRIVHDGIARTFQTPRLFPTLSVLAHVVLAARAAKDALDLAAVLRRGSTPWTAYSADARPILARTGLADDMDTPAGALPYGRCRLLELARALAMRPSLLLLDEPAAGLNDVESDALSRTLRDIAHSGDTAMLVVEHDVRFVRATCPRLVVLHQGALLCDGPTDGVLTDPRVKDAYLGGG